MRNLTERQKETIRQLAPLSWNDAIDSAKVDVFGIATVTVPSRYIPAAKMRVCLDQDGRQFYLSHDTSGRIYI